MSSCGTGSTTQFGETTMTTEPIFYYFFTVVDTLEWNFLAGNIWNPSSGMW
jgi:hypothetical protein